MGRFFERFFSWKIHKYQIIKISIYGLNDGWMYGLKDMYDVIFIQIVLLS